MFRQPYGSDILIGGDVRYFSKATKEYVVKECCIMAFHLFEEIGLDKGKLVIGVLRDTLHAEYTSDIDQCQVINTYVQKTPIELFQPNVIMTNAKFVQSKPAVTTELKLTPEDRAAALKLFEDKKLSGLDANKFPLLELNVNESKFLPLGSIRYMIES